LASPAFAATGDCLDKLEAPPPQASGRPVLVLIETNPWAMVLGAESPRFALYDTGLAIYATKEGYRQIQLDERQATELRNAVDIGALACLDSRYSTTEATDQPSEVLLFGRGGHLSGTAVYGPVSSGLPPALVAAYERLVAFGDAGAKPWLPEFIEVMIWPYEYAPDPSIVWPSKWPGLKDPTTVRGKEGYSLRVPSKDLDELIAFLNTRHRRGAVEVGGKKWAIDIRLPFPLESSWQVPAGDPE
jgi:hypothetical protein